jgi:hypothetical protein
MKNQLEKSKNIVYVTQITSDMIAFVVNHYKSALFGAKEIRFINSFDKKHFEENYGS